MGRLYRVSDSWVKCIDIIQNRWQRCNGFFLGHTTWPAGGVLCGYRNDYREKGDGYLRVPLVENENRIRQGSGRCVRR